MSDSHLHGRLSAAATRRLFFNAEDSATDAVFAQAARHDVAVFQRPEVLPEAPRVDPFASIHERNSVMDAVRTEAAKVSDNTQVLIKGPSAVATATETVALEELPLLVKQAAEQAVQSRLMGPLSGRLNGRLAGRLASQLRPGQGSRLGIGKTAQLKGPTVI